MIKLLKTSIFEFSVSILLKSVLLAVSRFTGRKKREKMTVRCLRSVTDVREKGREM